MKPLSNLLENGLNMALFFFLVVALTILSLFEKTPTNDYYNDYYND